MYKYHSKLAFAETKLEWEVYVLQEMSIKLLFHNYCIPCFVAIKIMNLEPYTFLFDKLPVMNDFEVSLAK